MSKVLLTLGFSTMGERLQGLVPLLEKLSGVNVEVLVVVQDWLEEHQVCAESLPHVSFVWSDTRGLSRSRNIAIEQAGGDFFWLLDDDVDIELPELEQLLNYLYALDEGVQVVRVRVGCLENKSGLYKSYSDSERFFPMMAMQMNSIELIVRRQWVIEHNLRFNSNIGLGTKFPGAEETHFLLDCLALGGRIQILNQTYVYHSCLEGGRRKVQSDAMMEIRGATASRFGLLGALLLLRWSVRYLLEYKRLSILTSLCRGFFNGYDRYR